MPQFQDLFFMLKRSSLCSFFNLRDCTFKVWWCKILLHKIVDVKPPPWKMYCSSEKLYEKYSLCHSNKHFCTDRNNAIKITVLQCRWFEVFGEKCKNGWKSTLRMYIINFIFRLQYLRFDRLFLRKLFFTAKSLNINPST